MVALTEDLSFLPLDPTAAIAPSADLIAYSRIGPDYRPEQLVSALESERSLYEVKAMDDPVTAPFAMVRPVSDLGLHLDRMSLWPEGMPRAAEWLAANDGFRRDVLALLSDNGPTLSKDIPDTAAVPWTSTGWTHNQNVTRLLELLQGRGEVAVAGRAGRQRTWDLGERVHPSGIAVVPEAEAGPRRAFVGDAGEPARVDGSTREWRVDPDALGLPFAGRTALLSPFGRLVHDRVRSQEVFGFEYVLEMYKPAAQRRWGYFALPILHGERLIGKLDAAADNKAGVLRVAALHEDEPFAPDVRDAVRAEIVSLAAWLSLTPEYTS
ncbi:winged helix DNA-binding domain-containing protein [Leifsonia shinshuensis]|uniref:DNA glycosylase AlkZ-like family protein n=1 Tax=Leifsonia shinshuensis TaxID=150026 RepID=UPI0027E32E9C|nr:crosslink repair DNA glycosylase YcaQ family protein [Leifsonia shinshuensis]MCI0158473.1 winged helix DNA-binding domain-containing protein [Leifsonia shinshuensis]